VAAPKYPRAEYEAALASELEDRAFVFLELPETICGVPCEPLTPRRVEWLRLAKSPFIIGGKVGPVEIAQFLWIVSKSFVPNKEKRNDFLQSNLGLDVVQARKDIEEYLDRAYLNAMGSSNQRPCISPCASYAYALAGEPYRMPWREVLDTPLGVIFQLLGALDMSQGRAMINKRSDKVNNDYAAEMTAWTAKENRKANRKKKEVKRG
jgi:hypothetical protein